MSIMQIVLFILLSLIIYGFGRLGPAAFHFFRNFPTEARYKNLKNQYADLFCNLDAAIRHTTSDKALTEALENIDYPPETLLVAMQKKNSKYEERMSARQSAIINRYKPDNEQQNHVNETVWNHGGYGHRNDQKFFIVEYPIKKYGYDYVEIHLARTQPVSAAVISTCQ